MKPSPDRKRTLALTGQVAVLAIFLVAAAGVAGQEPPVGTAELRQVVLAAFEAVHDGYSSDEVLLQTGLNRQFIAACQERLAGTEPFRFNWTLLNLRKAGQLNVRTRRRDPRRYDQVLPIAEICTRMMEDRHGKSIDRLLADPATRAGFDQAAQAIDAGVDPYLVRKAAFRLRKSRRLRPELITRIADWGREVAEFRVSEIGAAANRIPAEPGIYIFRDAGGYLYIGEAADLRQRLLQHLGGSGSRSLAGYLADQGSENITIEIHTFAPGSRIGELRVRRAYESELIRSRNPKFNVRP